MSHPTLPTPFSILSSRDTTLAGRIAALAAAVADPLLGLTALGRLYEGLAGGNFIDRALERLGIVVHAAEDSLQHVPDSGPVIVVANHPTGALDGLALAQVLMRRRRDVRLFGNHLLSRVPEMRDWVIAVDPFDPRSIATRRGVRDAKAWLLRGGLLVVFPAGQVSNVRGGDGTLVDADWQRGVLSLARWSAAMLVPAFVGAQPSRWFRLAGLIHPRLRTALLPRELLRLRNRAVRVGLGAPVAAEALDAYPGPAAQLAYLRARTYALDSAARTRRRLQAIAPAADRRALQAEIARLDPDHELLRSGEYSVFYAAAALIPMVLAEIGRLREVAFRAVGEGTGQALDLDRFDRDYQHLFVWHRSRAEVVGAYRVGATDRLSSQRGAAALYTHTLFALDPAFLEQTGPALELGRAFVRPEYQRESNALLLLWKGIGAVVARQPQYRRLFGPVSVSADYSAAARGVLGWHLQADGDTAPWRRLVRSRRPVALQEWLRPLAADADRSLDAIDRIVRELENGRGVPVLLRQYAKLGARVLGLSEDPAFGNSLDALMMVDLASLPPAVLQRYLGRDGAATFQRHHRLG